MSGINLKMYLYYKQDSFFIPINVVAWGRSIERKSAKIVKKFYPIFTSRPVDSCSTDGSYLNTIFSKAFAQQILRDNLPDYKSRRILNKNISILNFIDFSVQ